MQIEWVLTSDKFLPFFRNNFSIFYVGKEIVDVAAQMADQWAKEDKKEASRNKSDESLGNLINGKYLPNWLL
jgi:hypothetical protein